jgi:hypothetical protein
LKHERIAADIEQVLHDVLFFPEQEQERYGALVATSHVLHNLLNASLDRVKYSAECISP